MNQSKAPLSESEIRLAVEVIHHYGGLDNDAWFETITLDESVRSNRCATARRIRMLLRTFQQPYILRYCCTR